MLDCEKYWQQVIINKIGGKVNGGKWLQNKILTGNWK